MYPRISRCFQNLLLIFGSDLDDFGFLAHYIHVIRIEIERERSQFPLFTIILPLCPNKRSDSDSIPWTGKVDHIYFKTNVHVSRQLTGRKILGPFLNASLLGVLENGFVFEKFESATLLAHRTNRTCRPTHEIPLLLLCNNLEAFATLEFCLDNHR